jgi:hypothetical protein
MLMNLSTLFGRDPIDEISHSHFILAEITCFFLQLSTRRTFVGRAEYWSFVSSGQMASDKRFSKNLTDA